VNRSKIINTAALFLCGLLAAHLLYNVRHVFAPNPKPPLPYERGSRIGDTSDLLLQRQQRTVIIITSSRCPFCEASVPFYHRLTAVARRSKVRVVALTAEDLAVHSAFLSSEGVSVDAVGSLKTNNIWVPATPTLIVVRKDGVVLNCSVGKLDERAEEQVMGIIQGGKA